MAFQERTLRSSALHTSLKSLKQSRWTFGRGRNAARASQHALNSVRGSWLSTPVEAGLSQSYHIEGNFAYSLHMSLAEAQELGRHVASATTYFEWGAGGSTELAAYYALYFQSAPSTRTASSPAPPLAIRRAWSTESSHQWLARLKNTSDYVRRAVDKNVLSLVVVDIGATAMWGRPNDWDRKAASDPDRWLASAARYAGAVSLPNVSTFDVLFVDGRFRLACALQALHHMSNSSVLLLHDFFSRGSEYTYVFEFFTLVRCVDRLAVLRARPPEPVRPGLSALKVFASWDRRRLNTLEKALHHAMR